MMVMISPTRTTEQEEEEEDQNCINIYICISLQIEREKKEEGLEGEGITWFETQFVVFLGVVGMDGSNRYMFLNTIHICSGKQS